MQRLVVVVVVALVALGAESLPRGPPDEAEEKPNATAVASAEPAQVDPRSDSKTFVDAHGSNIASLPGSQVFIQSPLDTNSDGVVHPLEYLQSIFPFIRVVSKDEALATDIVDGYGAGIIHYLQQIIPIINPNKIPASEIENPNEEEPATFWDQLLILLLRETNILQVDRTDLDGDGAAENDINMSFTTVKFDPIGNLFEWFLSFLRDITQFDSLEKWWTRVKYDIENYTPYVEEKVDEKPEGEPHEGDPTVVVPVVAGFPAGVINVSKYDPLALGVNTLLFLLWNALFCKSRRRSGLGRRRLL